MQKQRALDAGATEMSLPSDESAADMALALQKKRQAKSAPKKTKKAVEKSTGSDTGSINTKAMAKAGQEADVSGAGGTASTLGDIGLASGNPYGMAAGAALKVVGSVQAKKAKESAQKARLENARRDKLMQAMARLGNGVGSLGMA
jgi:hypothetical protein